MTGTSGPVLFARYAYPPNALGYCGPDDSGAVLEYASEGVTDPGLVELARGFEGAWPYLSLIAGAAGIRDPLDPRVVRAYWVGGELLDRVDASGLCAFLDERFGPMAGPRAKRLTEAALAGAVPHHNFHVFAVSPWIGLMRTGRVSEPLRVMDSCRIRWGRVTSVDGVEALVRSMGLAWDGRRLRLGPDRDEHVTVATNGRSTAPGLSPGDIVAMHWDRVCDRLGRADLAALRRETTRALRAANRSELTAALSG
jgi:hypothetical protein